MTSKIHRTVNDRRIRRCSISRHAAPSANRSLLRGERAPGTPRGPRRRRRPQRRRGTPGLPTHAEELGFERAPEEHRNDGSERHADENQPDSFAENHLGDVPLLSANRLANGDFLEARPNRQRQDAVQADECQRGGQNRESDIRRIANVRGASDSRRCLPSWSRARRRRSGRRRALRV